MLPTGHEPWEEAVRRGESPSLVAALTAGHGGRLDGSWRAARRVMKGGSTGHEGRLGGVEGTRFCVHGG
ncbi:MAG: hypothetical protein AVDCRST_MAG24-1561 [uncultured Nocardioidaceae bacterium]|uniref:Uncharacterized protein n=1 Tax=uncultured Nocardioidaceae bacterium TaxID=253824 RepID=A0A6J4M307_9ACTN|nr:MAG: hypothetical protein AVDCRST_MAG24-1561 [uncultured Nocardioidaceae bacterium]